MACRSLTAILSGSTEFPCLIRNRSSLAPKTSNPADTSLLITESMLIADCSDGVGTVLRDEGGGEDLLQPWGAREGADIVRQAGVVEGHARRRVVVVAHARDVARQLVGDRLELS